jgi:hypothetical protein
MRRPRLTAWPTPLRLCRLATPPCRGGTPHAPEDAEVECGKALCYRQEAPIHPAVRAERGGWFRRLLSGDERGENAEQYERSEYDRG